jgi:hypothetical protein
VYSMSRVTPFMDGQLRPDAWMWRRYYRRSIPLCL